MVHFLLIFLSERYGHLLHLPPHYRQPNLSRRHADAIYAKGCPLPNVVVFIDATIRRVCRPHIAQEAAYSGYKKYHAIKYQNLAAPDGMIVDQWGPAEGRRSDPWLLGQSGIIDRIVASFRFPLNTPASIAQHTPVAPGAPTAHIGVGGPNPFLQFCAFGDKDYFTQPTGSIIAAFRRVAHGPPLTPAEQAFNTAMAAGRVRVEWIFLKVIMRYAYLDHHKQLKVFRTPVGLYYSVATLLTNVHSCLYGNQTANFFNLQPPSLEEYLAV